MGCRCIRTCEESLALTAAYALRCVCVPRAACVSAFPDTNTDARGGSRGGHSFAPIVGVRFIRLITRLSYEYLIERILGCTQTCLGSILSPEFWRSPLIDYNRYRSGLNSVLRVVDNYRFVALLIVHFNINIRQAWDSQQVAIRACRSVTFRIRMRSFSEKLLSAKRWNDLKYTWLTVIDYN